MNIVFLNQKVALGWICKQLICSLFILLFFHLFGFTEKLAIGTTLYCSFVFGYGLHLFIHLYIRFQTNVNNKK